MAPKVRTCALCSREFTGHEGSAYEGDVYYDLCHPSMGRDVSCYMLWTVYGQRPWDVEPLLTGPASEAEDTVMRRAFGLPS
jgi:hypothetical protein